MIDPSPIKYKSALKKKVMYKAILDSADFILKKKLSCPKFAGPDGIEGLLYVEKCFRKICKRFGWHTDGDKLFDNVDLLLEDRAADYLETIINQMATTVLNFDACMETFRIIYSSSDSRDIMYQYLSSSKCTRPKDVEVIDHRCRMETMFRYADRLAGMEPLMSSNMKRKTLILSFHLTHVLAYKSAGNKIDVNTSIDDVMEFMKLQKQAHDASDRKKKRDKPNGQNDNEKDKKKEKQGDKKKDDKTKFNDSGQELCKKHNDTHT